MVVLHVIDKDLCKLAIGDPSNFPTRSEEMIFDRAANIQPVPVGPRISFDLREGREKAIRGESNC